MSATTTTRPPITRPTPGRTYWCVTQDPGPVHVIVLSSALGVAVDARHPGGGGSVWTTRDAADAHLATKPTGYETGGAIPWAVVAVTWAGGDVAYGWTRATILEAGEDVPSPGVLRACEWCDAEYDPTDDDDRVCASCAGAYESTGR